MNNARVRVRNLSKLKSICIINERSGLLSPEVRYFLLYFLPAHAVVTLGVPFLS